MDTYNRRWQLVRAERNMSRLILRTRVFLSLLYFAFSFIFGETGLLKYLELREIRNQITREVKDVEAQNTGLQSDLKLLEDNPFFLEKHAREERNMAMPDEIIFKYVQ